MRASVGKIEGKTAQQMLFTGEKNHLQKLYKKKFSSIRQPVLIEKWNQLHLLAQNNISDT